MAIHAIARAHSTLNDPAYRRVTSIDGEDSPLFQFQVLNISVMMIEIDRNQPKRTVLFGNLM